MRHVPSGVLVGSEELLLELVTALLHSVASREQTKIFRHGHKYLLPLSHLSDQNVVVLATEGKEEGRTREGVERQER